MVDEWDEYAATWDDDPAARAYAEAAFASLLEVMDAGPSDLAGARVLDFGCGTGLLTEQLVAAGAVIDAVDSSPGMLAVIEAKIERQQWSTVNASLALPDEPPEHGVYDLIVCSSVCSFLGDYPGTAIDLVSRLDREGTFVQWDWEREDDEGHGLGRAEIEQALAAAGLSDVEVRRAFRVDVDGATMAPLVGFGRRRD